MGKIIVIGSQKGGVGKTTTTLNLAYSLKELGKKVLTVDFDSQANLTTCYGVEDTGALEYTIGHLMMDQMEEEFPESFEDYIQSRDGVDYLPSSIYLSVVDAKLRTEMGAERMLAEVLEPLKSRYDYILIDTCPSLGMLTINSLVFFYGGFCKLESEFQCGSYITISIFYHSSHILLTKGSCFNTMIREPLFHLNYGVWIIEVRDFLHGYHKL